MERTPLPWKHNSFGYLIGADRQQVTVSSRCGLSFGSVTNWPAADANADFVVEACNAFDALVAALDVADRLIERGYCEDKPKEWDAAYRAVQKARAISRPTKRAPHDH